MFPPLAVQSKLSEVLEVNRRQHQGGGWSGGKLTASWSARPAGAHASQKEILGRPLSVLPVLASEAGVLGKLPKKVLYSRQSCVCGGGRKEAMRGERHLRQGPGAQDGLLAQLRLAPGRLAVAEKSWPAWPQRPGMGL